jgi:transcriptional regulator with XRE-family HTH domain/tRNA G10  N-methylase Trm11
MELSQRLQGFRTEKNLSQEDLAALVGVKPITVLRWENGTSNPTQSAAEKLEEIGFGSLRANETKRSSIPRLLLNPEGESNLREDIRHNIRLNKREHSFDPAPYVVNGPENQLSFFETLYKLQEHKKLPCPEAEYSRRLSLVASVSGVCESTAQYDLEQPKRTAKHWNPNYGSHGWHRYIGRFPPQLVRALINHFDTKRGDVICDPFSGSGTTMLESRLLGMKGVGVEVCPLSSLISRTKSKFPESTSSLEKVWSSLTLFYKDRWDSFVLVRDASSIEHEEIIARKGNLIDAFPNYQKWMSAEALLGTSIVVEFANTLKGYNRDAICCALSACMRSIGNLDVDVVRAEYSKKPRVNVDVLRLVQRALKNMIADINQMLRTHSDLLSSPDDIQLIQNSLLEVDIPAGSVNHIITSPPYGVESISYLRTHLLSYRSLQPILNYDVYNFDEKIIGSEYVKETNSTEPTWAASEYSKTFLKFFNEELVDEGTKKFAHRKNMMVHFFDDMVKVAGQFHTWLRPGGRVAFVVGNKRLGEKVIPTDVIVGEIFKAFGLRLDQSIGHKLKCNNSNSEVPWQEKIIQDEFAMLFTNTNR